MQLLGLSSHPIGHRLPDSAALPLPPANPPAGLTHKPAKKALLISGNI